MNSVYEKLSKKHENKNVITNNKVVIIIDILYITL